MLIFKKTYESVLLCFSLLAFYSPSFLASSAQDADASACAAHGFKLVTQAVPGWPDSSGCDALPGLGVAQINQVCTHLVQFGSPPICAHAFYGDRTILACKQNTGQPQPEDNTYFKYILCQNPFATKSDRHMNWVRLQGTKQFDHLPAVIKQPLK